MAEDEHHDRALETEWQGDTMNVAWYGAPEYATFPIDSFHHDLVAVPGDWVHRKLAVRNNGPCPGTLTVELVDPATAVAPDTVNHDDVSVTEGRLGFDGMSELHWSIGSEVGSESFADLTDGQDLATVKVGKDAVIDVEMAYSFPYDETEGKNLGFTSQALGWNIGLKLRGDYCDSEFSQPAPTPSSSATPVPSGSGALPAGPTSASGSPQASGSLRFTGTNALFAAAAAAFLIAAGLTAVLGGRRRRAAAQP
jgi:hypothetical protein